jgi:hypothetical protein
MPQEKAKQLSGYSPKSKLSKRYSDPYPATTAQIRERLQQVAGVSLGDQVGWLAGVRDGKIPATTEQVAAAKTINKVLGYDAPLQIEQHNRGIIAHALIDLRSTLQAAGMTPRQMRDALRSHGGAPLAIETEISDPTGGENLGDAIPASLVGCPSVAAAQISSLQMEEVDEGVFDAVEK